jgi:hypothetical protein
MPSHYRVHTAAYVLTALFLLEGSPTRALAERQQRSQIVAAAPTHDFGTARQGQPIVHAFVIQNRGTQPQVIDRVDLSQRGMNARFARQIDPGQERTITITSDTKAISGEARTEAVVRFQDAAVPGAVARLERSHQGPNRAPAQPRCLLQRLPGRDGRTPHPDCQ